MGIKGIIFFSFCFTFCALSCDSEIKLSEDLASKKWKVIQSSDLSAPNERHEAAFINVAERLFLLGGRGIKPVDIFDLSSQSWSEGSAPPIEIHHFQPIVHDHLIYILGAMTGPYPNEKPIEHIIIYDTIKDEWIRGAEIPKERLRGSAGVVKHGHEVYLICGIKNGHLGDHKIWMDKYNIQSEEWTILADAPRPRDHFQATYHNGKIYAIGGRTTIAADNPFKYTIKQVDIYDLRKNVWFTAPNDIPTERAGTASIKIDDMILIAGGESFYQNKAHDEVELLNTENLKWVKWSKLPIGRHGTGIALVNSNLYMCSGSAHQGGGPELDDLLKL